MFCMRLLSLRLTLSLIVAVTLVSLLSSYYIFVERHCSYKEIQRHYRAASICLVTSLHDGMNLVSKEFVAARNDEQGVLILSRFTGAARELLDAVLVNPHDIEQTADAIWAALELEPEERMARMTRLRKLVKEQNIYRWAGSLIDELCGMRLDVSEHGEGAKPPRHAISKLQQRLK